nr:MAG TPA: hypothetical protein [Caudoviricetes sp.]
MARYLSQTARCHIKKKTFSSLSVRKYYTCL